uniref:Odorant receptor n=1 Tax=Anopheles christyi TaxID=43041 RepID=A0A182K5A4_9DIPT
MYIVERLRAIVRRRLERRTLDPRSQHTYIVESINRVGGLLGINVFTSNYSSTNLLLRLVVLNSFMFFWINLYNLTTTYGNLVEFMYCLETLLYVGIAWIKMYTFVKNKTHIMQMHLYMVGFFDQFYGEPEQDELLVRTLHHTTLLVVLFGACSSSAAVFIFVYSLIWSVLVEYALPFGFFIPSVGADYLQGFALNYAFQLLESTLMVIGIVSSECAFFMLLLNACLQVDMLSYSKRMCNLFVMHFFIVFGCIFCQLISIVVVIVSVPDWYPGYFLFVMLTVQLFFSCALGQIFNIKCDELTVAIYNVPWYNMEVRDQKAMRLLLMASQQPGRLSYGFGTVNMRAFFEIYRKTYSIGMMMISVNEED